MNIHTIVNRFAQQSCERCGGHLDHDICMDISNSGCSPSRVLRCIQYGDVIDEVILQNRAKLSAAA